MAVKNENVLYGSASLDVAIRSRMVSQANGLQMHVLEAGFEEPGRPTVLLLHGFPELAYSFRHQLVALAEAGYHVLAPDQRGYGLTTGWSAFEPGQFRMLNLALDIVTLLAAMGIRAVHGIVGHDFGSPVAGWCALVRPDVFKRVVLMSAPFAGSPALDASGSATTGADKPRSKTSSRNSGLPAALAALEPPREHYQWYYASANAGHHMANPAQGTHRFFREYYYLKSADWPGNKPARLASWSAKELARLPRYYVMDAGLSMPETTRNMVDESVEISPCRWLPDEALDVYVQAYQLSGFQGALRWYYCNTKSEFTKDQRLFAGKSIEVPACFIAGVSDWGIYQSPGQFERMQETLCSDFRGVHLLSGAGHWVQQEQSVEVNRLLVEFFGS